MDTDGLTFHGDAELDAGLVDLAVNVRADPPPAWLADPIAADPGSVRALGCKPVIRDLLGSGPKIRHDPAKLARVLLDLAAGRTS